MKSNESDHRNQHLVNKKVNVFKFVYLCLYHVKVFCLEYVLIGSTRNISLTHIESGNKCYFSTGLKSNMLSLEKILNKHGLKCHT